VVGIKALIASLRDGDQVKIDAGKGLITKL